MESTFKFLVGDQWRGSKEVRKVINPYNHEVTGEVYFASAKDLEDAILATEKAFEITKKQSSTSKTRILESIAQKINDKKEELARTIVSENAKPIKLALTTKSSF